MTRYGAVALLCAVVGAMVAVRLLAACGGDVVGPGEGAAWVEAEKRAIAERDGGDGG